jgi:hypothetical protein
MSDRKPVPLAATRPCALELAARQPPLAVVAALCIERRVWPLAIRTRTVWALLVALVVASACGGSGKPADEPGSSAGSVATSGGDEGEATGSENGGGEEETAPRARACNDETCFACGEGLCLKGMYCDVGAGPGCSWLPECAKSPSCACITRVLGSQCKCDDSGGGPEVECGSS